MMAGTFKKGQVKFHKDTFDKTTTDRRERVLEVAISEFATKGYNATNINEITKKSNISTGAMYSYFASKEDLFLTIVNNGYFVLEKVLKDVAASSKDISDFIERMLVASREYAIKYPELNQIYLNLTTQGLSQMAKRLSNKLETITIQLYRDVIRKAKSDGRIRNDIDEDISAFCIDSLITMYQFSFSSDYYKERMSIFLGKNRCNDIGDLEKSIMSFIKSALEIIE